MSFSNNESKKILKENELLHKKIYEISKRSSLYFNEPVKYIASSYNKIRKQEQIFLENQVSSNKYFI